MGPSALGVLGGIIFFLVWLAGVTCVIIAWIIALVALWRGMRAHESIAESLKQISEKGR